MQQSPGRPTEVEGVWLLEWFLGLGLAWGLTVFMILLFFRGGKGQGMRLPTLFTACLFWPFTLLAAAIGLLGAAWAGKRRDCARRDWSRRSGLALRLGPVKPETSRAT